MNVLFVYSKKGNTISDKVSPEDIQIGISYISALLKNNSFNTDLLVLQGKLEDNFNAINKSIKSFQPSLICFTSVSTEYSLIRDSAKYIKLKYKSIFLLAGGAHVSVMPEKCILDHFDAICIGEGEYATLDLASKIRNGDQITQIHNLWIKNNGKIEKNPTASFIQNIDSLPFPDRDIWQKWLNDLDESRYSILLGRGCPFNCTYCSNHVFKKLADDKYVRFRSPENIIKELKFVSGQFPRKNTFYLEIETIAASFKWAFELCNELQQFNENNSKKLYFAVNMRIMPNQDYDHLFDAFTKANICEINIGLESGSEKVRKKILKRNYSNQDVINTVNCARKYNLKINFFNLIGIPGETKEDFWETIRMNRECNPDLHFTSIFCPYPGTELYRTCIEKELISESFYMENERREAPIDLPGFSKFEINKSFILFDYYAFKGKIPLWKIIDRIIRLKWDSKSFVGKNFRNIKVRIKRLLKK